MSEMNRIPQNYATGKCGKDIFLLTKPQHHDRAILCRKLIAQSGNAVLYLAGDGVYNLLGPAMKDIQKERVLVCREDLEARGLQAEDRAIVPVDFYEQMVKFIMNERNRTFTF